MTKNITDNSKRNLSLFLGCIAPNRYPGIESATRKVMERLGISLTELEGASCCPAPGVFQSFDKKTWLTLASRNLCLSESLDADILTVCNGCYATLADTNRILKEDPEAKAGVNEKLSEIGKEFSGKIEVRHIVEYLFREVSPEKVRDAVTHPLDLRVAVHYGCHLIKPSHERKLGSAENPSFFDELVEATGARSVEYEDKTACCGAGGGARSAVLDVALALTEKKLGHMQSANVDCIVDACPFCHLQFDQGQIELADRLGKEFNIPVLHYSQFLGLALGYSPEELGIHLNRIQNSEFYTKLGERAESRFPGRKLGAGTGLEKGGVPT
ncbi:CoB--CoM heterodisulfide reductase subunit B [Methanosarcina sp. 1.H.A.2.2]|uniref:CoB--CoM heterodisulfide reductase subunit B n=1 Tax=Methanosarcina sp. 1.H.A.2.2 TaxID=1483601 RepID=UPI0006222DE4|nr:CoB--CoM heterodisulfide reductase subunit B [Methanosarcina sp. 1.H.A.2.2]KKH45366.1 disulfide reductase [Methanosarcina sp. 1.H.A.2.2]